MIPAPITAIPIAANIKTPTWPVIKPGLWLQGLTTRPPTPEQIEVAIVAMSEVLKSEDEHHTLVLRSLQPPLEYRT